MRGLVLIAERNYWPYWPQSGEKKLYILEKLVQLDDSFPDKKEVAAAASISRYPPDGIERTIKMSSLCGLWLESDRG